MQLYTPTMKKKLLIIMLSSLAFAGVKAASKPTILTVKENLADTISVTPYGFEADTEALLQNWYLQNYVVLDSDVESKDNKETSESEYIERLSKIPATIEMPYNAEVRRYIDLYVIKKRTLVEAMLGMSLYYMPIFEQALEAENLPLELKYLPVIESALDPVAKSPVGAAGLWQFMVKTGKGLGLEINSLVDERLDPYKSSKMAAKYLKELHNIYNDWSLAIAAYNCGPGTVNKALRRAGGKGKDFWQIYAFLPKETREYVPAFIAANYIMTYFKYHNISPALAKKPIVVDTVQVNRRIHFNQIANTLNIPVEALRVLNPQYRKDVIPGNSKPYTLALPSQQIYSFIMSEDSIYNNDASKYQPRTVVEPVMEQITSDENGEYTFETKKVTKYHKVKRGENISKIAKKYGVSVASIKKTNKLKSNSLKAGQKLKIVTTEKVKVYKPKEETTPEEVAADDSLAVQAAVAEKKTPSKAEKEATKADKKKEAKSKKDSEGKAKTQEKPKAKKEQAETSTHTVKSGESLYLIAKKYGITVDALKKANSIKNNQIKPGQKLTIPKKKAAQKKSKAKKKSSKRKKK